MMSPLIMTFYAGAAACTRCAAALAILACECMAWLLDIFDVHPPHAAWRWQGIGHMVSKYQWYCRAEFNDIVTFTAFTL
jgi:hypothetical protein